MSEMDASKADDLGSAGDLLWEVTPIADAIGRTPRQTHYLLTKGELPAKKVGGRWVASRKALAAYLTSPCEAA